MTTLKTDRASLNAELGRVTPDQAIADAAELDGWERPTPLSATRHLPPFPIKALPGWLADFVEAEAEATQTPPDLAGMLVLDALATVAGGIARVQARQGWSEPVNLFTAVALDPGSRKSAVFSDVTRPIVEYERTILAAVQDEIVQLSTEKKIAERAAEAAQVAAGKKVNGERTTAVAEAISAAEHAAAIDVPVAPQLLADDATPEALASLLAEQGERIALLSPEGDLFDMMAGRYSSTGPNLAVYLKGHAGDSLRVNRKGRPAEHLERPALTIGLAVQPDVIRALAGKPGFRGQGLLARFLYSLPPNTVGRRKIAAAPVPELIAATYDRQLRALAASLAEAVESNSVDSVDSVSTILRLDEEAAELLREWEREIEPRLGSAGDLGYVADWGSKLAGATIRIAGLLHLAEHLRDGWAQPINADTLADAIELGRYLVEHALAVFDLMGADPSLAAAERVLDWISQRDGERFTVREAHAGLSRGLFRRVEDVENALVVLGEHGYVRLAPVDERKGPGRKPSPTYEVNPLAHRGQP